jgi:DNA-binding transcriptional LysR family regulator
MELRQLKYFEVVARTLNFSRASEILHIAQPPLSRQIQQLEDELGVQLLDRSTRPMKLTNAGQFFYDQSSNVLARLAEVKQATKKLGGGTNRWMGIGFVPSILYSLIPKVIREFSEANENLEIALSELTSVQQAEALKAGRIDVGFGRLSIQDESLENIILDEETLCVAVPSPSELEVRSSFALKDLVEHTLIVYPASPRPSFADQVLRQFEVRGYEPKRIYETNGLQTAIGLVAAGMGVSVVPKSVQRFSRSDVSYRPLSDSGLVSPLIMTVRTGDITQHLTKFKESVTEHFAH